MSKSPREHIGESLGKVARELCFERGFSAVTMRDISKHSGVPLSTIYNYYRSKEELCRAVLASIDKGFKQLIAEHFQRELDFDFDADFQSEAFQLSSIEEILHFAQAYREELRFMHRFAEEPLVMEYWQEWTDLITQSALRYMEEAKVRYPHIHAEVSPIFLTQVAREWQQTILRVALSEQTPTSEMRQFLSEYMHFHIGGFKQLTLHSKKE